MDITTIIVIGSGVVLLVLVAILVRGGSGGVFSPYRRKRLITRHELVMLSKIRQALRGSEYEVYPQVAMGAVMDIKSGIDPKRRLALRNRFDRKIIDFVIADREGFALVLIELDDSSHSIAKDAERDRLTASAGYPTLRYRNAKSLRPDRLRNDIKEAITE